MAASLAGILRKMVTAHRRRCVQRNDVRASPAQFTEAPMTDTKTAYNYGKYILSSGVVIFAIGQ